MPRLIFMVIIFLVSISFAQTAPQPKPLAPNQVEEVAEEEETNTEEELSKIADFLKPFFYSREDVRDPFEPLTGGASLRSAKVYGPFLATQQFRLSEFKLKGLVWNTTSPVALFMGPKKELYRLRIKDYIGENFGYIAMIREKEVIIVQTIEEDGKRYSTTKVVFLE